MGSTSPKNKLSTAPLPVNCVMTAVFQDGSLPFQHTHKHSSPFHQVTYTQIANHYNQQARNLSVLFLFVCLFVCLFLSVGEFLRSSAQPHGSAVRLLQRVACHIKGTRPLVDSGATMGNGFE